MPMRTRLVKCGNRNALPIPAAILQQASFRQYEELNLTVMEGRIIIRPLRRKLTLASLVAKITPENRHAELDWGSPAGKEMR